MSAITVASSKRGPAVSIVSLTPTLAAEWLKRNTRNRPLNKRLVANMAQAMLRGEWKLNGESIKFDADGGMLDGQHRATAVVVSGVTILATVVHGLEDGAFETIDRGKKRTVGDILAVAGEKNCNVLASAARMFFCWKAYGNPLNNDIIKTPTAHQIMECIETNPGLRDASDTVAGMRFVKRFVKTGLAAFALYAFRCKDVESANEFFELLNSGVGLERGSSVLVLRNRLLSEAEGKGELRQQYKAGLLFKAYKKFAASEDTRTLRVRERGDSAEKDMFIL